MAAVHFTTIPCEPYTAHKVQRKPYFCNIFPCANDIVYARFEDVRTFLYFSMRVVRVFVCLELWVKLQVAIFSYGELHQRLNFSSPFADFQPSQKLMDCKQSKFLDVYIIE